MTFPVYERISGRRPWTELGRLRALQWRPAAELEGRAMARVRSLMTHAGAHVPHYRELFAAAGVTAEAIGTVDDMARIPVTTKADLRRRFPEGVTAENLPARRRRPRATSGSTGLPFQFFRDWAAFDLTVASYMFFLEWAGSAFWHTRVAVASPRHFHTPEPYERGLAALVLRLALGRAEVCLPAIDLTAAALRDRVARIGRPYFLWAIASHASRLAREILEHGITLRPGPEMVMCAADSLSPGAAVLIGRAFRAPVVNHYSCREISHIAQSCPDNPALFHVNAERVVVRVVRDDGSTAAPGERGRLLVTDLANEVMPFINYEMGDTAVLGPPCPCGRGFPTLSSIEGRSAETLVAADGRTLAASSLGMFLVTVCDAMPYVWEYQAVQRAVGTVELRIVPTERFSEAVRRRLEASLESLLGPGTVVRVHAVDQIEREPSGKRLIIKSCLDGSAMPQRG